MIDKLRQMAQTAKQDGAMVCVSPETIEQLLGVTYPHQVRALLEVIHKQPDKIESMFDAILTQSAQNDDNDFWTPASVAAGTLSILLSAVLRGIIEDGNYFEPTGREITKMVNKNTKGSTWTHPQYKKDQDVHIHYEV